MLKRTMLGIISSFAILIAIFLVFIVDWRKPADIISKQFGLPIRASDMRCLVHLNDEYTLVDTQNYDPAPFLMTFYQPIHETEVFTKKDHEVEIVAVLLKNPRGRIKQDAYCEITLSGEISNQEQNLFKGHVSAKISFDENGEVIVTGHDQENAKIKIERNDDGGVKYISVMQTLPIRY